MTAAAVLAGIGGLILGSFANVVAHRVPRRESIVRPPSACPACGTLIRARDNVPLVSWILLRGRCRQCRARISARYPIVEATTGLLFALAVLRLAPPDVPGHTAWDLVAYLPALWVLVPLSAIDLEHKILPDRIVLPSAAVLVALLGLAAALGPGLDAWLRALAAGAASSAFFIVLVLIYPAGMGMGDAKLAIILGMALGYLEWPRVFLGFLAAFALGSIAGIGLMAVRRAGRKTQLPFGPFLALGTAAVVLYGGPAVDAWLRP